MARRSRDNRRRIPGYEEERPSRDDRAREHRRVRHQAHQILNSVADPDEVEPIPEVRRTRPDVPSESPTPARNRFKVWKTKFWKRRDSYKDMKAELDSRWEEMVEAEEEEEAW